MVMGGAGIDAPPPAPRGGRDIGSADRPGSAWSDARAILLEPGRPGKQAVGVAASGRPWPGARSACGLALRVVAITLDAGARA